jgi:pilus assembly protein CpaE
LPQISELDEDLLNGVMQPHPAGIKVLLAPPEPQYADSIRPEHLESIIKVLRHLYDFVVIDTWTSLYDQVLTLLDAADRVVVLLPPEIAAVKNTRLFFDIAERLGYPPEKIMLVLNKWDRRSGIRPERLESVFNHKVDGVVPVDDRTVLLSVNQGQPFVLHYKTAPISQSVIELSKRLLEVFQPEPALAPVIEDASRAQASRMGRLRR